jgi:hypothetical protein
MIPKSLHTVTAIVNVARMFPELLHAQHYYAAASAAAAVLGYPHDVEDTYGLITRAAAALQK